MISDIQKASWAHSSVHEFRADRMVTLGLVRPLRKMVNKTSPCRIPILMYHSISEPSATSMHPYYFTETAPDVFRRQMSYLRQAGYRTLTPAELLNRLHSPAINYERTVLITFDDGYRDFYTNAFPVLEEHGFKATVYLPTQLIRSDRQTFLRKECLTWEEIRCLQSAGTVFGSHSATHSRLYFMSIPKIKSELQDSKDTIEQKLGSQISSFAYPYAFPEADQAFTAEFGALLDECGYSTGMSTSIGSINGYRDRWHLKRLPVNFCDDEQLFSAKLEGSYDWLYWPQYLTKRVKLRRALNV
jgi:peptidoglycan/xylan/chitin deacetylase (PgdA/CDA1 family)